jgi:hypothetical protein
MEVNFTGEITGLENGIAEIKKALNLENLTGKINITVSHMDNGLNVSGDNGSYFIEYAKKADFFRALSLLAANMRQGVTKIGITERIKIEDCGVMFDCSRNAVPRVETLEDIFRKMACMGINTFMLYTEDMYEIDESPYFGYMRGRYSKTELKELDKYAADLGIELIPCIQTLGHLASALKWQYADGIKDRPDILLAGEPKTYEFIEAMLKTCRECFSTDRIHIGMDEA